MKSQRIENIKTAIIALIIFIPIYLMYLYYSGNQVMTPSEYF
jgi:hypothetical protein